MTPRLTHVAAAVAQRSPRILAPRLGGMSGRRRDQRGASEALELAMCAVLFAMFIAFVVGLYRIANARSELNAAAEDAARAASLQRNTALSGQSARDAAAASLGRVHVSCRNLDVHTDLSNYEPGGYVRVTVTCDTKLSDVAIAGFPGHHTFCANATVPIETTRAS